MPNIVLQAVDSANQMQIIKIVREVTGIGLAEAQKVIENVEHGTPYTMVAVPKERIAAAVKDLESAGCTAAVEETGLVHRAGGQPMDSATYNLFGKTVTFSAAENRYLDLLCLEQAAFTKPAELFSRWYQERREIEPVLRQYLPFTRTVLEDLVLQPLFQQLAEFGIYDVSWETYGKECAEFSNIKSACQKVASANDSITRRQTEEEAYREDRKAGRSRVEAYGVGLSGALKGAAMAGMMNATTGLAHSMVNAVGNAGSALSAASSREKLYQASETRELLQQAIWNDIYLTVCRHIDLLNRKKDHWIENSFSGDRAKALFENAKNIPGKREELLAQAFTLCPWDSQLLVYIFANYPDSRRAAMSAAQRFSVDLSAKMEVVLAKEYTNEARQSEAAALATKDRILALMEEYGVEESNTLDELETDCLRRVCQGYESADQDTCGRMAEAVKKYEAKDTLKEPFLRDIQKRVEKIWTDDLAEICRGYEAADEAACEKLIHTVREYSASDAIKGPFLKKLQSRIEEIWSAEDGEIFDNLYLKTDIFDQNSINEAISYVQSKGRTASAEQYLAALRACTPKKIKSAQQYKHSNLPRIFLVAAVISILSCLVGLAIVGIPLAIVFLILRQRMKKDWETLTLNGKVVHPVLAAMDDKIM